MIHKIQSYCGLSCNDCPIFHDNSNRNPVKLAEEWSIEGHSLRPEEMTCLGCKTLDSDEVFLFCKDCRIRLDGLRQERSNYAHVVVPINRKPLS